MGASMRVVLAILAMATTMVVCWCAPSVAQTEEPYDGPKSVKYETIYQAGSKNVFVDLSTGVAVVKGWPCRFCGPTGQGQVMLDPDTLAQMRFLAIDIRDHGRFHPACVAFLVEAERLAKQGIEESFQAYLAKLDKRRKQPSAEWRNLPLDGEDLLPASTSLDLPRPYAGSTALDIEGVGRVGGDEETGPHKSRARCATWSADLLMRMLATL